MSVDVIPGTTVTKRLLYPCSYCGNHHNGACPKVKAIEYHPNGTVKRVEFR